MSLSLKIFLIYLFFVLAGGYAVTSTLLSDVKPVIRQSTEETLVDTANLLAEMLVEPMSQEVFDESHWRELFQRYGDRRLNATIWGTPKKAANHRIYVTDRYGKVVLDSKGSAVGEDYSQWRDVYLTLRGKYGARTTREDPKDERSTIMHVAAPIQDGNQIIGVVTVAKPNRTVLPYIRKAQQRIILMMGGAMTIAIAIGAFLAWWFGVHMKRLQDYAISVKRGERVELDSNSFPSREMRSLASAMKEMRQELDGKEYVEDYVQSLTHEFKSPLAGINAALEILQQPIAEQHRQQFLANAASETSRLAHLIERLLELARIEKKKALTELSVVQLHACIECLFAGLETRALAGGVTLVNEFPKEGRVVGDPFLLELALSNLLDNALAHCREGGVVRVRGTSNSNEIEVFNEGEPIPDYALSRLTERFYALPRPRTGKKSSGLGLNFVAEIAALHQGEFSIRNQEPGVVATLHLGELTMSR